MAAERMTRRIALIGAVLVAGGLTALPAVAADDYYQDAAGKTGAELKAALHGIISSGVTTLGYDDVWTALKTTDQDPANASNVRLFYSGESRSKDANGGGAGDWNREHVWAKSHGDFGTSPGPGTDIHHLRATDVTVNSIRGSKDFDNGGAPVEGAPGNFTDDDSFEPSDAVKGDVARIILYMGVRWDGGDGFADLEPNDKVDNGSAPAIGRVSVLLQWHQKDPVDAAEQARNEAVFGIQKNRNPFVDHPEWAASVYG